MIFLLSVEKRQSGTWELWVGRMLHLHVWLAGFGMKDLGVFFWAACQMNSLAGITALVWHWAALVWRLLGNRGHPAQTHQGTLKDLGLAELSALSMALWRLCGSVLTRECDLWVQESWPSFPWASETKLLFLQAARQINIFPMNWPPSILQC